jgi:hypothetical protein
MKLRICSGIFPWVEGRMWSPDGGRRGFPPKKLFGFMPQNMHSFIIYWCKWLWVLTDDRMRAVDQTFLHQNYPRQLPVPFQSTIIILLLLLLLPMNWNYSSQTMQKRSVAGWYCCINYWRYAISDHSSHSARCDVTSRLGLFESKLGARLARLRFE